MKNLLFVLLSISSLTIYSQNENMYIKKYSRAHFSKKAIEFQNTVRDYYSLKPLRYSKTLSKQAQVWANHLEEIDQLNLSEDTLGETIYALDKSEFVIPKNIYLDAAVGWLEAFEEPEYYQTLCGECEQVGFGIAENELNIYVVAKYDKIYD